MGDERRPLARVAVPQLDALVLEPELGVRLADQVADAGVDRPLVVRHEAVRLLGQVPAALQLGREDRRRSRRPARSLSSPARRRACHSLDEVAELVALERRVHRRRDRQAFGDRRGLAVGRRGRPSVVSHASW